MHNKRGGICVSNKTTILVVDDNKEFANILQRFLTGYDEFEVVGVAYDGNEAVDLIINLEPDVIILDIIMPVLDGIGVMQKIKNSNLSKEPEVLAVSVVSQEKMIKEAIKLGVSCFMLKPLELDVLAERIKSMTASKEVEEYSSGIVKEEKTKYITNIKNSIEIEVTNVMHDIGIPAHVKGHQYLRDAIISVIKNSDEIIGVTKRLYPDIAKKYNTTSTRVERSIRHAIEMAWDRGKTSTLQNVFGYTINLGKGKPTNSEFIALVADKLRLEMDVAS